MEEEGKCSICREDLSKETGMPDVCNHIYCFKCINKWAKTGGPLCPLDRKIFKMIITPTGRKVKVKSLKRKRKPSQYDISSECEVCENNSNDASDLLMCDSCDLGYHLGCLNPPLLDVPEGDWYCPECQATEERMRNSGPGSSKLAKNKCFATEESSVGESSQTTKTSSGNRQYVAMSLPRLRVLRPINYSEQRFRDQSSDESVSTDDDQVLVEEAIETAEIRQAEKPETVIKGTCGSAIARKLRLSASLKAVQQTRNVEKNSASVSGLTEAKTLKPVADTGNVSVLETACIEDSKLKMYMPSKAVQQTRNVEKNGTGVSGLTAVKTLKPVADTGNASVLETGNGSVAGSFCTTQTASIPDIKHFRNFIEKHDGLYPSAHWFSSTTSDSTASSNPSQTAAPSSAHETVALKPSVSAASTDKTPAASSIAFDKTSEVKNNLEATKNFAEPEQKPLSNRFKYCNKCFGFLQLKPDIVLCGSCEAYFHLECITTVRRQDLKSWRCHVCLQENIVSNEEPARDSKIESPSQISVQHAGPSVPDRSSKIVENSSPSSLPVRSFQSKAPISSIPTNVIVQNPQKVTADAANSQNSVKAPVPAIALPVHPTGDSQNQPISSQTKDKHQQKIDPVTGVDTNIDAITSEKPSSFDKSVSPVKVQFDKTLKTYRIIPKTMPRSDEDSLSPFDVNSSMPLTESSAKSLTAERNAQSPSSSVPDLSDPLLIRRTLKEKLRLRDELIAMEEEKWKMWHQRRAEAKNKCKLERQKPTVKYSSTLGQYYPKRDNPVVLGVDFNNDEERSWKLDTVRRYSGIDNLQVNADGVLYINPETS